jgi:two-component system, response regulator RpfG
VSANRTRNVAFRAEMFLQAVPPTQVTVMIVDDQAVGRSILEEIMTKLEERVQVRTFARPTDAVVWATQNAGDLVIVDYQMPEMDGIEFVRRLRLVPAYEGVPIVMVTVNEDREVRYAALDSGVDDFLSRPVDAREMLAKAKNMLALRRQQIALQDRKRYLEETVAEATRVHLLAEKDSILRLLDVLQSSRSLQHRETRTLGRLAHSIAREYGMSDAECDQIEITAPLHDIGNYLVSPGLVAQSGPEGVAAREAIEAHTKAGYEFLKGARSPYLRAAGLIALSHHERFDGSGFPNGLVGETIPVGARIVAVAEVYDAMTEKTEAAHGRRHEDAIAYIRSERGKGFDPRVVDAFMESHDLVRSPSVANFKPKL